MTRFVCGLILWVLAVLLWWFLPVNIGLKAAMLVILGLCVLHPVVFSLYNIIQDLRNKV